MLCRPPGAVYLREKEPQVLVLTRHQGEKLLLGDNIEITIVRLSLTTVVIGIEAPPEVKVLRKELERKPVCGSVKRSEGDL